MEIIKMKNIGMENILGTATLYEIHKDGMIKRGNIKNEFTPRTVLRFKEFHGQGGINPEI